MIARSQAVFSAQEPVGKGQIAQWTAPSTPIVLIYKETIVEPVFGQIKQARGFRQFLLRGLAKVRGEWALVCLTHNILKLHRLCSA